MLKKPTIISFFAGCGGSSTGYHLAGFRELGAYEWWNIAAESFSNNYPDIPVYLDDIMSLKAETILKRSNIKKGELDIMDGSPPCQGFSTSGKRKLNDTRNNLFDKYIELISGISPKIFLIENVSGMIKGKYKGKWNEYIHKLNQTGYLLKIKLINAANHGVPQNRQRIIIIGFKSKIHYNKFKWPAPENPIILYDALQKMPNINDKNDIPEELKRLTACHSFLKPGQNCAHITKKSGFSTIKLDIYKPANTILKMNVAGFTTALHPIENRSINIIECKRIFSFPDNYKLCGTFEERWGQLGNSVPPQMIKRIAQQLKIVLQE